MPAIEKLNGKEKKTIPRGARMAVIPTIATTLTGEILLVPDSLDSSLLLMTESPNNWKTQLLIESSNTVDMYDCGGHWWFQTSISIGSLLEDESQV